mgnify:CR=1 FL=1
MIKVLFICLGNICRSPLAEFYFKDLAAKHNLSAEFYIESAATSYEETGNPVHPGTRKKLVAAGISCAGKTARCMEREDYGKFDYLIGMDQANIRNITQIAGGDPEKKIYKMMEFTGSGRDVADPWYTGDFEATYRDVSEGCQALLEKLKGNLAR